MLVGFGEEIECWERVVGDGKSAGSFISCAWTQLDELEVIESLAVEIFQAWQTNP